MTGCASSRAGLAGVHSERPGRLAPLHVPSLGCGPEERKGHAGGAAGASTGRREHAGMLVARGCVLRRLPQGKEEPAERAGVLASSPMSGTHAPLLAGPPGCFPEPCLSQPIQSRRGVRGPPSVSTITEAHRILDVAVPCSVDEQLRVCTPYAASGWDTVRTAQD